MTAIILQMSFESVLILLLALLFDQIFAETKKFHPLVGFGRCATYIERHFNRDFSHTLLKLSGLLAIVVLMAPILALAIYAHLYLNYLWVLDIVVIYFALGTKSLVIHGRAVFAPLQNNDIETARSQLSKIVSRDTEQLTKQQITVATVESLIENSNDAIYAVIFWYLLAGLPGVVVYRLINTLDAMWGYKSDRYLYFGWAAAKLDDVMNYLPARITVLLFAVVASLSKFSQQNRFIYFTGFIQKAFQQGRLCSSPNAGPVMAAGALAINVTLGGRATYQTVAIDKPVLGSGQPATTTSINAAIYLVHKTLIVVMLLLAISAYVSNYLAI